MPQDYDYKGPGVTRPHPRKNWINPDAHQVHFASNEQPRRGGSPSSGGDGGGRSPLPLVAGLIGLVVVLAAIALLVIFVLD